ncbi:tyrosine/DOPA decarboxylase 1 [Artemisia annua]|uniref:Tyrosine/DOPA decarboxylase 1 n=1 Tax=Artemisia annua TaxID=35608 RepID=A0A2U1QN94_ARTAN|nr:tyrosine/DOPA decarboxylase 1 [Artemisia annua]
MDPLGTLCEVAKIFDMLVHVDTVYLGKYCLFGYCMYMPFYDGVEGASSFGFNPHKGFQKFLDCCCLLVKHRNDIA